MLLREASLHKSVKLRSFSVLSIVVCSKLSSADADNTLVIGCLSSNLLVDLVLLVYKSSQKSIQCLMAQKRKPCYNMARRWLLQYYIDLI